MFPQERIRTLLRDEVDHDLNAANANGLQANYKVGETVYATNAWERRTCESFLIQVKGKRHNNKCTRCKEGKGPYFDCRTLKDEWDGACGYCKKIGRENECSLSKEYIKMQKEAEKLDAEQQKPHPGDRLTRSILNRA